MKHNFRKTTKRQGATLAITLFLLVTLFVSPAYADTLGPNLPGLGENVTGIGTVAWADFGNITLIDGVFASVTVPSGGGISNYLRGTQFGFAIPSGSTIEGIMVEISRTTVGTSKPELRDYEVKLVKGGTVTEDNKADLVNDWPHGGTFVTATYGGPTDLWNTTWTAEEINASGFGIVLAVRNQNTTQNKTARVDYMRITVHYSPPLNPALTLVKTATPTTYDSVSDVIGYSYLVTNSGNVPLAGPVSVSDNKATVTCPNVNTVGNLDGFLDPSENITCTASYTIVQADLNAGSVTNVATASADGTTSNQDSETVYAILSPELLLVKSASPTTYNSVDDVIGYTYLVTNSGNVRLAGPVTVSDNKATATCPNVNTVGNLDSFLDPGENINCTASYTIVQADLNAGSVTNVATASADGTTSNQDSETVNAVQSPALTLDKTATPLTYDSVGDVIGYTYLVTNSGNVRLAGPVSVSDNKATATCPNVNTVGNLDGFLDPGENINCTASYTIVQADLNAGSVTNVATASADGTTSNQDSETVNAAQSPALTLDKTATPLTYDSVGDVIGYSYLVNNSGNVRLAGPVSVSDNKASATCPNVNTVGNLDGFLDPGENITCTASYTIVLADLITGSLTNVATASTGGTISNQDSVTVNSVAKVLFLPVVFR